MAKRRTKISVRRGDAATSLPKEPPTPSPAEHLPQEPPFPIVGIGASAGGLEAFTRLLQCLPPDPDMALVLVQHLDPSHDSMLTELLSRVSKMPVRQVRHGMGIEPNHVYVIPPNVTMTMTDTSFTLLPRTLPGACTCRSIRSSARSPTHTAAMLSA